MAKSDKPAGGKPSKMTVMLFQLEGSDETLQEGFRTVSSAIDKLANPVIRVIGQSTAGSKSLPPPRNVDSVDLQGLDAEPTEDHEENKVATQGMPKPRKASSGGIPRQPKILDLDLKAGVKPLRQYLEEKNPAAHSRKCLLIAAWLKANLGIDEVNIYTGYRHMGWTSPKDITAPIRAMKRAGQFKKGKEEGTYAINHIGIDLAETHGE